MNRILTRIVLGFALVLAMLAAFSRPTAAQQPLPNPCCTFTVDVAGFNPACFPVKLLTRWSGQAQTDVIGGNGVFVLPIIPCPPVPAQFFYASLDGGITQAWFNAPAKTVVNGCCFITRIGFDATGCIIVYLRPC